MQELSQPLKSINETVLLVKEQNEKIATQVDGISGDVHFLCEEVSALRRQRSDEGTNLLINAQNTSQNVERAIIRRLDQCGAQMDNGLSQQSGQIAQNTAQLEALVSLSCSTMILCLNVGRMKLSINC